MKEVKKSSIKLKNQLFDAFHTKDAEIGFYELADFRSTLVRIKKELPFLKRGERDIKAAKRMILTIKESKEYNKFMEDNKDDFLELLPLIQDEVIDISAERNKSGSEDS